MVIFFPVPQKYRFVMLIFCVAMVIFSRAAKIPHCVQGWKPKPKPENLVLKEILETQTETASSARLLLLGYPRM